MPRLAPSSGQDRHDANTSASVERRQGLPGQAGMLWSGLQRPALFHSQSTNR